MRVLRRDQLAAGGWSRRRVEHEIRVGRWQAVAPTVIALQNAPLTYEQRLWLGVLHGAPGAVLSHATACTARGLDGWDTETIHVLTRKGDLVEELPGFWFHQSRREFAAWVHPTCRPASLRIEAALLLAAERDDNVRRAVGRLAAGVQQRLTTAPRMLAVSREISKLRHGKLFRLALNDIAGGAQSFAEIDLGRLCGQAGLAPPARQRTRRDPTGRLRYLDAEWELPAGGIVVLEVDGSFHLKVENWWSDMVRERAIVMSGRIVLRCSSVELRLNPWPIVADLRRIGVPPASWPLAS